MSTATQGVYRGHRKPPDVPRKPTGKPIGYPKGKPRKNAEDLVVKFKVSLPPDLAARLDAHAARREIARSGVIAELVEQHVPPVAAPRPTRKRKP